MAANVNVGNSGVVVTVCVVGGILAYIAYKVISDAEELAAKVPGTVAAAAKAVVDTAVGSVDTKTTQTGPDTFTETTTRTPGILERGVEGVKGAIGLGDEPSLLDDAKAALGIGGDASGA